MKIHIYNLIDIKIIKVDIRKEKIMQRSGVLLVLAPLLGICAASTPAPAATWPANEKKGCLLLNKKHNFTELTGSCSDSQVCVPGDNADPHACSQCEDYDAAVKVSYMWKNVERIDL